MEKFFTKNDYADAEKILAQLSVKTNCFDVNGKIVSAKYVVCIDDDITSAFYAADLYHLIFQTYGFHPTVLCVGGVGPLSKYINPKGESEGKKLEKVCLLLGVFATHIVVLDNGTNTGLNCLDIYNEVAKDIGSVVVCLTQRLSLRFKQTFEFLDHQYSLVVNQRVFSEISASVFYYVPPESLDDMMQLYNCKGLCKGVLLLSEIASIYDRISRYSGKLQKPLNFDISLVVAGASKRLAKKYPLKINMFCFNGLWQFVWVFFALLRHKKHIRYEMRLTVKKWHRYLQEKYR